MRTHAREQAPACAATDSAASSTATPQPDARRCTARARACVQARCGVWRQSCTRWSRAARHIRASKPIRLGARQNAGWRRSQARLRASPPACSLPTTTCHMQMTSGPRGSCAWLDRQSRVRQGAVAACAVPACMHGARTHAAAAAVLSPPRRTVADDTAAAAARAGGRDGARRGQRAVIHRHILCGASRVSSRRARHA